MGKERIDRILGHMELGSRQFVKRMVRDGRVVVDGVTVDDPGFGVDPTVQEIRVDGEVVAYQRHFYFVLHKPAGVITATEDARHGTVFDVLPPEFRVRNLSPVGRLDKDTEGLLLFTTDGELSHRLLSPRWHVAKRYLVRLERPLPDSVHEAFAVGIVLDDGYRCLPAQLAVAGPQEAVVTVFEGKYHQVKRMFEALGNRVEYLKRLSMGPIDLGDLGHGSARPLSTVEIGLLKAATGLAGQ